MVPPASDRISRVSPYSGSHCFPLISVTGLSPSSAGLSMPFSYPRSCHVMVLQPRPSDRFGLLPFARRYSENHSCFLFLQLLRCFSSPGPRLISPCIHLLIQLMSPAGSPIRTPPLLRFLTASPSHFAVCRVLLRRSVPRHSPYALSCFTF